MNPDRLFPYSEEVYRYVLNGYRDAYWPVEAATVLGVLAMLALWRTDHLVVRRLIAGSLAGLWAWLGYGFYIQTYQAFNWAGLYFGYAALAQAILIMAWGGFAARLQPELSGTVTTVIAVVSLGICGLQGLAVRVLSSAEPAAAQAIGLTPFATIIATLAILLINRTRAPLWMWIIPTALSGWEALRAWVLAIPGDSVFILAFAALAIVRVANSRNDP